MQPVTLELGIMEQYAAHNTRAGIMEQYAAHNTRAGHHGTICST